MISGAYGLKTIKIFVLNQAVVYHFVHQTIQINKIDVYVCNLKVTVFHYIFFFVSLFVPSTLWNAGPILKRLSLMK